MRDLPYEGQDFLRLASLVAVAPIPPSLVVDTFLRVDSLAESQAKRRAIRGQHQAELASLAERREGDMRFVHALVSRTMRFHDVTPKRRETLRAAVVAALTNVLAEVVTWPAGALEFEMAHARALLGADEPWDLSTATLAAWVAANDHQRGLYLVARPLQEHVLEIRYGLLGAEHPDTLAAMSNLATILQAQGDLAGAQALQERALEGRRRILGDEHPDTLTTMNNLATTLWAQGDLPGARALQEDALGARRRLYGEEHRDTLMSVMSLAATLEAEGDLPGARTLHEEALRARRGVLGEGHPDTLRSMINLGEVLRAQGDLVGARALQEQALGGLRRVLGDEHPDTLTTMQNLAVTLQEQNDFAGARPLQERVFDVRRRRLGERHEATTTSAWNLSITLVTLGDRQAAIPLMASALLWLRDADPADLTANQRAVKTNLQRILTPED